MNSSSTCVTLSIHLRPDHLAVVRSILREHVPGREVRAFGSRVTGPVKPTSDLDLCVMGEPLSLVERSQLHDAFSDSLLPFKVDVIYWAALTARFRRVVEDTSVVLQQGSNERSGT